MKWADDFVDLPTFQELSNLPRRSKLFSLVPIQIGLPLQEALISFLVRVSRAHSVSPRRLVSAVLGDVDPEIAPLCYAGFFRTYSRTINGLGQYAEKFSSALKNATCVDGLENLTMLPWREFFPHNGQGMLAAHPRWCPVCLYYQQLTADGTYFPLAWALEAFKACPIHGCRMAERCPHCFKSQPFVPKFPEQGICNECLHSLASTEAGTGQRAAAPSASEKWVSKTVGDMIAHHSKRIPIPTLDGLRKALKAHVDDLTDGNRVVFCRKMGLPPRALNGWMNKGERPSMSVLLELCRGLNIPPQKLASPHQYESAPLCALAASEKVKRRVPRAGLKSAQRKLLQEELACFLANGDSLPVSGIAAKLGVSAKSLRYWFPHVCGDLSARYRIAVASKSRLHQAAQARRVETLVRAFLDAGKYPSRRKIGELLRLEGMALAQPHLIQEFRRVTQSLRFPVSPIKIGDRQSIHDLCL